MGEQFRSHVHLDSAERSKLLCRLDEPPDSRAAGNRRRWQRWEYRMSDIAVMVLHPGGGTGRYLACARNLSAGGVSFIHGGFIHLGSECRIVLPKRDGAPLAVSGTVVHCRHLERSTHEIGAVFAREIDTAAVLSPSVADGQRTETLEIPALSGQILVVDQSLTERRLMALHLGSSGATLKLVDTPGAALDAVRRQRFDLVACDINLESFDAIRMIRMMREVGYRGPILVVTAENQVERLVAAREAGANAIVGKPYNPAYLASLLREWLQGPASFDGPIFSTLEDTPGMLELIADYIDLAMRNAARLLKAVAENDLARARELILEFVGTGAGHGFAAVTEAARASLMALQTAPDRAEIDSTIRRLAMLCGRLRCARAA